jgi:hypothetical protein
MALTLGFLIASLLGLLIASAFWSRAVRLTTKRLKESMPVSEPEIRADRDKLRAEYAIKVHKLATQLEQAKFERARHLIDINRRDASISSLETSVSAVRADLEENQNARRVLEQTVADRLPKVEARLTEAKRLLFNRDREIAELTQGAKRHKVALEEASSLNAQKAAQIDRLNNTLSGRGGRRSTQSAFQDEASLRAQLDSLRTKTRDQAALIDRLQKRLAQGLAPGSSAQDTTDRDPDLMEPAAGSTPGPVSPPGEADPMEGEIRALRSKSEDQAGEITRLKAALAAFERPGQVGKLLGNSKIALQARIGSAEAQTEHQAATISKLRAELAASNERLARQAAHFMDEMRRVGAAAGSSGTAAQRPDRDGRRRNLVDRVAYVRPALSTDAPDEGKDTPRPVEVPDQAAKAASGNGHSGNGGAQAAEADVKSSAAQMSKTAAIEERPKLRLLDRLTSLTKN